MRFLWPSPLDFLLTQLEYKAAGRSQSVNIQKETIQMNWGLGSPLNPPENQRNIGGHLTAN